MSQNWRINLLGFCLFLFGFLVSARLFYWQVVNAEKFKLEAENQHWISFEIPAGRGEILASDGFPLATNEESFLAFASLSDIKEKPEKIAQLLVPIIYPDLEAAEYRGMIEERLAREDLLWVPLKHKITRLQKESIEKMKIEGIGFEEEPKRDYPEGSSSAYLLGFVGMDANGSDKGYFGLEGNYDLELKGKPGILLREKDASGRPILVGEVKGEKQRDGRNLVTTIDRSVQFIIEEKLKKGIQRYGALNGSVIVMEPKTGAIVGLTSFPSYDPESYFNYDKKLYPNPVIASSYEPGSTFKVLVMAAALNEDLVRPDTRCDKCSGPVNISGYTIKTWNEKYYPDSTMTEVIQHSDNVGMVFVAEKLGIEKFYSYLKKFGLGEKTGVDLQEESSPELRQAEEWGKIDLATASFGQGIALTPMQMLRAVGAIANKGVLMKPYVVEKVTDEKGTIDVPHEKGEEVIRPIAAEMMTEMMVNAVDNGEAKWAKPKGFRIAGKTGTAQIPVAGHYDQDKTIASFVGFAPAPNPKFVMLVMLREPTSSPWGSETAAPLWFDIAKELFTYYGILPS